MDNPKLIQALKDGKAPLDYLVYSVLEGDALVHKGGADKYGIRNWLEDKIKASTYEGAILRHFLAWAGGEDFDPESGFSHLYHVRACCAILLDSEMNDTLIDDRGRCESINNRAQVSYEYRDGDFRELAPHCATDRELHFAPTSRIDEPHEPTMEEIRDIERGPINNPAPRLVLGDTPHWNGPWDVVFVDDLGELTEKETRRGPYETVEQAQDYAQRNPERLPGTRSIRPSTCKVRNQNA